MPKKRESHSVEKPVSGEKGLERRLIENLIELQKVHVSMAEKFDSLSKQISNLLGLFELAARSFAQHPANLDTEKDKEFLEKIDKLLEQNKTLAKGLTLMEERIRERVYGSPVSPQSLNPQPMESAGDIETKQPISNRPLPRF